MQKFLRTLMLAVAMLLPFASQAQTDCTSPQTVPYSENFDAYTGNATSTSAPTGYPAITLPDCWSFLNMSATTSTYPQVFLSSSTTYAVSGNCLFFKSGKNMRLFAVLPAVSASATETYELTFMYRNEGTTAYNGTLIVGLMTDVTDSTTFVALDTCARTTTKTEKAVTITGAQLAGARVAICYLGGTSQNYYAAIDNVSLHIAPTCFPVTNLAVTAATTSSMTLTWADAINTTATYIVYDMSDTSVVFSGISDTTYTVTGLDAATNYTFGVASDCGGGDVTAIVTVSGATGCDAITSFPWSEDFESYDASSSGVTFSNPCWVNEHISGSGSYFFEVYSSTSGTGGNTTKMLRLHDMSSGTMTKLALPMMDIPVGSNYIFSLDIYRNATGSSYLGEGIRVFVSTDGEIEGATELAFISRNYTVTDSNLIPAEAASGWYNYELPLGVSGSCYIILRGESKYGSATYMDNFVVMEAPSCAAVTGLTMTGATPNSITLGWTDASNTGASYVVYDMSDTSVVYDVVVTDTSAEIFNLTPNTVYTFGVAADCGGDEAPIRTVSARTACAPMELPWSEDFSTSVTNDPCWSGATKLASEVFAGQSLTLTTPQWTYASTTRDGLAAGHYYKNVYGTSCMSWIITPEIDLSTAVSPMLSFSAAFTKWNAANPAEGDITDDQFLVIVSTDGGQTWLSTNATSISLSSLIGTEYVNQYVDLSAYVGDTVRIAFYAESTVTGGDNDLHIDNITIDEMVGELCMPVTGLAASAITAEGATLSWNGTAAGSYTVVNMADGSVVTSGADTTYTLTGLTAMTQYSYGVVANCTSSNSDTMVVTFNTACDAVDLPYTETFAATSGTRNCWDFISMNTGNDLGTSNGMGFVTVNNREVWRFSSYSNHGGSNDYNQYGYSPLMNVSSSATNLEVNVTFATYNSANKLNFGYITATDTVWNENDFTTAGSSDFQTETFIIPATATQLAVHYYGNYSYYAWIDSVVVTELAGEYCYPVTGLAASAITTDGATLIWNSTAAGSYTIIDMADSSFVATVADTTYDLTGLTAMTQYAYGVVANCSSSNSDTMVVVFNTACAAVELPYTEGFEETSAALGCWLVEDIAASTGLTTTGAYSGSRAFKFSYNTNPPQYLISPELSGADNGVTVSFMYKVQSNSYPESFQLGYSTTTDDVEDFTWGTEQTNLVNTTYEQYIEYLPAGTKYVAFKYTANDQFALYIDSVVFAPMSGSYCYTVSNLAVDTVTTNSITLSWNDANNSGATYSIYSAEGEVIASGLTATTYTVTGLTALTGYTFGVVANCSETDASNVTLISASTACAGATCDVYIYAEDSYGDGWNGASIDVMQGGAVVANYTLLDTAEIAIVEVCASAPVSFVWNSGSYDYEASFMIIDVNGDSLFAAEDASDLTDGAVFFATATPCSEVSGEVTITFAVNDATMGTTTPAPGTYTYEEGETISLSATAYEGYRLSGWHIEIPMLSVDTTVAADFPAYTDTVSFVMNGSTFTAIFAVDVPEATIAASDILYWVGEGSNQAVLAINWPDTALAWGYRFNGTATVQDMIEDIAEADPRFSYTIENGYLSDFTFVCENGETLTGANAGYWESKNNGISDAGMAQTLSNGDFEKWANSAAGVVVDSIYYEGWGWSYIYNYPMTIHPVSVPQGEIVTITFTVNDASMGTITPSGVQTYHVGETLTVTATPYAGYQLVAWQLTIDGETQTVTEDITTTYTDAVIPEVDGAIITAVFQRETGIDDVEAGDFKAYSIDSRIVVKGVENMNVNIYDVTGRVVYNEAKAAETIEFTVPSAGVYMVKAGNAPAKRVVVVR